MLAGALLAKTANGCTNLIVTPGASKDGSTIYSYAADSAGLYGTVDRYPANKNPPAKCKVYSWDTGYYLGDIDEAAEGTTTTKPVPPIIDRRTNARTGIGHHKSYGKTYKKPKPKKENVFQARFALRWIHCGVVQIPLIITSSALPNTCKYLHDKI